MQAIEGSLTLSSRNLSISVSWIIETCCAGASVSYMSYILHVQLH